MLFELIYLPDIGTGKGRELGYATIYFRGLMLFARTKDLVERVIKTYFKNAPLEPL